MSNSPSANENTSEPPWMASAVPASEGTLQQRAAAHPARSAGQSQPVRGRALAVYSGLGGGLGFILMYLVISTAYNRPFLDLLFFALSGVLGDHLNFWGFFVAALLLAGSGIFCGHWTRRIAQSPRIRSVALLGLWGGYLTLALVGGFFLVVLVSMGAG